MLVSSSLDRNEIFNNFKCGPCTISDLTVSMVNYGYKNCDELTIYKVAIDHRISLTRGDTESEKTVLVRLHHWEYTLAIELLTLKESTSLLLKAAQPWAAGAFRKKSWVTPVLFLRKRS